MDAVLAGISTVPLHLAVKIGDGKGLGQFYTTVALDPPDDVVGRRIKVRPTAMAIEFKFLAMRGYRRHDGFRRRLAAFEGRGGEDTAHDYTRVHVPRLRLKA